MKIEQKHTKKIFNNINTRLYVNIFLITLALLFLCFVLETNVFFKIFQYLIDEDYRSSLMLKNGDYNYISTLVKLIFATLNNFEWNFDYILIWSTNIFQVILPFFGIVGILLKNIALKNINLKKIFLFSIKLSFSIFFAYFVFYCIIIIICKGNYSSYITREMFIDIIGRNFYYNHIYIYYILDGLLRFLIIPFIYMSSSMMLDEKFIDKKGLRLYIVLLYFTTSIIFSILSNEVNSNFIYLNPATVMVASSYININSTLVILFNFGIFILSIFIYRVRDNFK